MTEPRCHWLRAFGNTAAILSAAFLGGTLVAQEPAAKSLAELPDWPLGFEMPGLKAKPDKKGVVRAPVLVWTPPQAKRLRALLIIPNNSDSKAFGEHPAVRAVATKQEMAIVYLRNGDEPDMQAILDAAVEKTGIAEFRHAPWIPFGKSSRGLFPALMAWNSPSEPSPASLFMAKPPPGRPPRPRSFVAKRSCT